MREQPSAPELIQSVADFLRSDALPQLEGLTAFHARVAVNVLEIVKRELERGPQADAAELAGLRTLLGRDGSLDGLNQALCARIAGNELSLESPGLLEHLMRVALGKLSVDQPGYSTYQRLVSSQKEKD
jgi:hypothetical protein